MYQIGIKNQAGTTMIILWEGLTKNHAEIVLADLLKRKSDYLGMHEVFFMEKH